MSKHEVDEFFCKRCKKSMVGMDGFCMNCGHDTTNEMDLMYEDEEVTSLHDMSDVDFGEEDWDE